MICETYNCKKFVNGACDAYPTMGAALRDRLGYCPVLNDGPNRPRTKERTEKKRVGQQHQKKIKK